MGTKLWSLIAEQSSQYTVFVILSVIIFILTGILYPANRSSFQRFFGGLHPLAVISIVFVLGLILFSFLLSEVRFAIYQVENYRGILLAMGLAVPFAVVMMLFDRMHPLPIDINVPFPESLFFYPVMGYVVELLFHILAFSLIYFMLRFLPSELSNTKIIWICILVVAVLEPVFQVVFTSGLNSSWAIAYLGLHLYLFNVVQLLLFRRYDFISMYSFRFSYYLLWHVLWGHLRLSLLF